MNVARSHELEPTAPAELVRRILAGEASAEAELVERYSRGIAIIVRRIVRDHAVAQDLCQETFRRAIEKIRQGEVREAEKLSGFVCSLARNLAIEHRRLVSRRAALEAARPRAAEPASSPLTLLLRREREEAVRQALEELSSPRDRELLYRFYIIEEEKDAICRDLGLTALHFNRVLFRARERFRAVYRGGDGR
jgi:RNA polymerase sigma-70 factor (ECF subfamily)